MMSKEDFLNPHIDNSHDRDKKEISKTKSTLLCNAWMGRRFWVEILNYGMKK